MSPKVSFILSIKEILGRLQASPDDPAAAKVARIIEAALIDAVLEEQSRCIAVASQCCSPEDDKAHEIEQEIRRTEKVLIANLSALR